MGTLSETRSWQLATAEPSSGERPTGGRFSPSALRRPSILRRFPEFPSRWPARRTIAGTSDLDHIRCPDQNKNSGRIVPGTLPFRSCVLRSEMPVGLRVIRAEPPLSEEWTERKSNLHSLRYARMQVRGAMCSDQEMSSFSPEDSLDSWEPELPSEVFLHALRVRGNQTRISSLQTKAPGAVNRSRLGSTNKPA
jgi:hypothetical protein